MPAKPGVSVGFLQFVGYELVIIPGLIVLAAVVGYLPALAAYRTDVAKALQRNPVKHSWLATRLPPHWHQRPVKPPATLLRRHDFSLQGP